MNQQKLLEKKIELGFKYLNRKEIEAARKHFGGALEIDHLSSQANTGFALIYENEGEYKLAEKYFHKALQGDSKDTKARFYYAIYLVEHQRFEDARKQLLTVTEDVDYNNRALAFISLGQIENKLGNIDAARTAFEKVLLLNRNMAQVHLEIADLEYLASNYQQAVGYLANYTRLSRRKTARSLWLGVRLEHRMNNRDGEASYGLALEKMYPDSKENLAYQQWRKNR